jgi:chaperone modulatory protein CbpM
MQLELTEMHWLDEHRSLTMTELAELSGLPVAEICDLVETGALKPMPAAGAEQHFSAGCLAVVRTAVRLRSDFELNSSGLALALTLLQRMRDLEQQLRDFQAQLPRPQR